MFIFSNTMNMVRNVELLVIVSKITSLCVYSSVSQGFVKVRVILKNKKQIIQHSYHKFGI